jgi:hypothetical protein
MRDKRDFSRMPDFAQLRASAEWDFTLQNYIESRGTMELAVAFADLFWPEFEIRDGCILRTAGLSDATFRQWWVSTDGDQQRVERALNLLHVGELVPSDPSASPEMLRFLAETLADMWLARLRQLFPDREFVVRAELDEPAGPTVLCYQREVRR